MAHALLLLLFIPLTEFARALNHTTIKLYSMENIERAIKAAIAKIGLEFSLKDETLYLGGTGPFVKW